MWTQMKTKSLVISSAISLALISSTFALDLEGTIIGKTNSFLDGLTSNVSEQLLNNDTVKHLEFDIQLQEHLKPTLSLTNVNKIYENVNSAFFNQNTLSIYDRDQTVNLGLGYRTLINEDRVLLGANIFFDYSFDEAHQRNGAGLEAISSVFDLRANYYDATSGIQTLGDGSTEEALDGWDTRLDYHLPIDNDVRIFASLFEFENASGLLELKGEKYGLTGSFNNLNYEAGYIDDNKTGDGSFASIKYTIPLGNKAVKSKSNGELINYVSVRNRLYDPVKRENKIRVVKISATNIVVSGF